MRVCAQIFRFQKRIYKIGQVPVLTNHYIIERKTYRMKKVITVFTAKKARQLLKEGFTIVDIKPDRLDPSHKRTLFLFKNEPGLMDRVIEKVL